MNLKGSLGYDWGVCANPKSPRTGLLTFEQGCKEFETSGLDLDFRCASVNKVFLGERTQPNIINTRLKLTDEVTHDRD